MSAQPQQQVPTLLDAPWQNVGKGWNLNNDPVPKGVGDQLLDWTSKLKFTTSPIFWIAVIAIVVLIIIAIIKR